MKIQSLLQWTDLNRRRFYYNSSQDKIGFISHKTDDIPVPSQFQIPSLWQLNMSPHELELIMFINDIFCHLASSTKSWNGPVQLLPMDTSLFSKLLHIEKTNGLYIPQYYLWRSFLTILPRIFLVVPKLLYIFPTVPNLQQVYASSTNHHGVSAQLQLWSFISTTKSCHSSEVFNRACINYSIQLY